MEGLEFIDFRDCLNSDVITTLKEKLKRIKTEKVFGFITDYEPEDCYLFLQKKQYIYYAQAISDNEYRIIVSNTDN